ncbi:HNH endonuclease [Serratia marcescens]|nr:HNH endonuclease [Serratia marcescens]
MAISEKAIKILWSNAAGICSFSGCNEKLSVAEAAEGAPYTIGEMAHIKGNRPGSNRYDIEQPATERDSYENLILLCPTHHTLIDKVENVDRFSVEILHEMKSKHETSISNRLAVIKYESIDKLKDKISACLAESHQSWEQYGPLSDNAKKNPNSEQIYAIWISERLSIIVPNNREIVKILQENRELFSRGEQVLVSKFIQHAESYEKWVNDEIPYNAIQRFPLDFETLILGE